MQRGVDALSGAFILGGGGWLEDQDGLDEQEGSERLEQRVRRDERAEFV